MIGSLITFSKYEIHDYVILNIRDCELPVKLNISVQLAGQ